MRRSHRCLSLALALGLVAAASAVEREFNWVPSGVIDVGDRASEAAAKYDGFGETQALNLGYRGEKPQAANGRLVASEKFVINPASYRGGPAPANLAILRCVDSSAVPGPLTVKVGETTIGTWTITAPTGERCLFDALFVIPRSAFAKKDANGNFQVPGEVPVTITGDKPALSLGYRAFATRDWDVLGDDLAADIAASAKKATGAKADYLAGVLAEGMHDWSAALAAFTKAAVADDKELARLARVAVRRATLRVARAAAAAKDSPGDQARPNFDAHYTLGVLAGTWGCWDDALAEMKLATLANPTHPDATYRLAEAMEYCRMPIAEWAPLFERSGMLAESEAVLHGKAPANIEDVLIAVHLDPIKDICGTFSQGSMEALQRDWRYTEQQLYGASRGAWKMRTTFMICGSDAMPWVLQPSGHIMPKDAAVPITGMYDYSVLTAEYGSSDACGADCGPNGCGEADIGPTRGWEVLMHEWNHEFDWVCVMGEQVPGYAPTHDSDNCGKQPIVSMGCGHRSSMHYYMNRAQYRRHEAADPVVPEAFVDKWSVSPVLTPPTPPDMAPEALAKWLADNKYMPADRATNLKKEWEGQKKAEADRVAKPAVLPMEWPMPPVPDWPGYVAKQWDAVPVLNTVTSPDEAKIGAGEPVTGWKAVAGANNYVDLGKALTGAPSKAVAYARTFVYSPVDQEVRIWIGYNDDAAVWLNGRKIHRGAYYQCAKWEDMNRPYELAQSGRLMKGWNCLAFKVERGGGNWGFSAHIVDTDNRAVSGLKSAAELPAGEKCNSYKAPEVGKYYTWADVRDDFMELTPRLTADDLAKLTGVKLGLGATRFLLTLPEGTQPAAGSRYIAKQSDTDIEFNNYLNWDCEAAAAIRYVKDGKPHDLLLVRPEYYEEFARLLKEPAAGKPAQPAGARVLGHIYIPSCDYPTTGERAGRTVLVFDASLGEYPADDMDLIALP
jgi:hypothetical protein